MIGTILPFICIGVLILLITAFIVNEFSDINQDFKSYSGGNPTTPKKKNKKSNGKFRRLL